MEEQIQIQQEAKKIIREEEKENISLKKNLQLEESRDDSVLSEVSLTMDKVTELVPGEKIDSGKMTTEEINSTAYSNKLSEINQPANTEFILAQGEVTFAQAGKEADPLTKMQEALVELNADHSQSSDSAEMAAVKRETKKLIDLMQKGVSDAALVGAYRWVEHYLQKRYLEPRVKGKRLSDRHKKVQRIVNLVSGELERLKTAKASDVAETVRHERGVTEPLLESIARGDKSVRKQKAELDRLLKGYVPMKQKEFDAQRQKIIAGYEKLIKSCRSIAGGFALSSAAKLKRVDAERIVLQLERERGLFEKTNFEKLAKDHRRTWDEDLLEKKEEAPLQMNTGDLKERRGHFLETDEAGIRADSLTKMFMSMTGASYLMSQTKKAELTEENGEKKKGLSVQLSGERCTHEEAVKRAKEIGKNLTYSMEALKHIGTIQIIDMITGQKNRRPESYIYTLEEQKIEGEDYLVISSVSVSTSVKAFGTDTIEDLNKDQTGEDIYTRRMIRSNGTVLTATYDFGVADGILSLDPEILRNYCAAEGLGEDAANAFMTRLTKMQEALSLDKTKGRRHQSSMAPSVRERNNAILDACEDSPSFYGSKDLLRDYGDTEGEEVKKLNASPDAATSNVESMKKVDAIGERVRTDMTKRFGGGGLNPETQEILELLKKYTDASHNTEDYVRDVQKSMVEWARELRPEVIAQIGEKARDNNELEALLRQRYGSPEEMLNQAEEEPLIAVRPLLENRIKALEGEQNRTQAQEAELKSLRDYHEKLFKECSGKLEVPGNASIREIRDTGFESDLTWIKRDKTPLFCHEPRISDVVQGNAGDCYFLSTLASVLEHDPEFVKKSMKDNGDGTVTVRFYQSGLLGGSSPLYVKVQKTISGVNAEDKAGAHGALWVKLYEKAFVASGLRKNHWFSRYSYKDICEGYTQNALFWLTGEKGKDVIDASSDGWYTMSKEGKIQTTNKFTQHVKTVRQKIQDGVDQKKVMMTGTFKYFTGGMNNNQQDEGKMRGMMRQHAYSVLGLEVIDGKEYVKLRNQTGSNIPESVMNKLTGKITYRRSKKRRGIFYLDLFTYAKLFQSLVVSQGSGK